MIYLLTTLHIIVCVFLILVVLLQHLLDLLCVRLLGNEPRGRQDRAKDRPREGRGKREEGRVRPLH